MSVSGVVVDTQGRPIEGARVSVNSRGAAAPVLGARRSLHSIRRTPTGGSSPESRRVATTSTSACPLVPFTYNTEDGIGFRQARSVAMDRSPLFLFGRSRQARSRILDADSRERADAAGMEIERGPVPARRQVPG